ncbi:MAG: hypothetical protein R3E01_21940 [Pirellulaceae bacterium]|nr:hypothetical protein [Planctomycetales bacterium]
MGSWLDLPISPSVGSCGKALHVYVAGSPQHLTAVRALGNACFLQQTGILDRV